MKKESKNKAQVKTEIPEIESEEIIPSDEIENDEADEFILPSEDKSDEAEEEGIKKSKLSLVPQNAELSDKQKIKAIKRTLENKKYALDRESQKCSEWLRQADERDAKAQDEYDRRKSELEDALLKAEERYNKRINRTLKMWREYTDNYLNTKVLKIKQNIQLLENELQKLELSEASESDIEAK